MNVANDSPRPDSRWPDSLWDDACARTREHLSAIADGELSPSAEVARHVERCPECAGFAAQCAALSSDFAPLRELELPSHAATRVWAGIAAELAREARLAHDAAVPPRAHRAWRARFGSALAGMAASIALALVAERLGHASSEDHTVRGEAERALNVLARVVREGDDLHHLDERPERQLVRAYTAPTEKNR